MPVTIRTHEQLFGDERERKLGKGLRETAWFRNRPRYKVCEGNWLCPGGVMSTLTASIVWGVCGKMSDL